MKSNPIPPFWTLHLKRADVIKFYQCTEIQTENVVIMVDKRKWFQCQLQSKRGGKASFSQASVLPTTWCILQHRQNWKATALKLSMNRTLETEEYFNAIRPFERNITTEKVFIVDGKLLSACSSKKVVWFGRFTCQAPKWINMSFCLVWIFRTNMTVNTSTCYRWDRCEKFWERDFVFYHPYFESGEYYNYPYKEKTFHRAVKDELDI